jgi:hypothetical protein
VSVLKSKTHTIALSGNTAELVCAAFSVTRISFTRKQILQFLLFVLEKTFNHRWQANNCIETLTLINWITGTVPRGRLLPISVSYNIANSMLRPALLASGATDITHTHV